MGQSPLLCLKYGPCSEDSRLYKAVRKNWQNVIANVILLKVTDQWQAVLTNRKLRGFGHRFRISCRRRSFWKLNYSIYISELYNSFRGRPSAMSVSTLHHAQVKTCHPCSIYSTDFARWWLVVYIIRVLSCRIPLWSSSNSQMIATRRWVIEVNVCSKRLMLGYHIR